PSCARCSTPLLRESWSSCRTSISAPGSRLPFTPLGPPAAEFRPELIPPARDVSARRRRLQDPLEHPRQHALVRGLAGELRHPRVAMRLAHADVERAGVVRVLRALEELLQQERRLLEVVGVGVADEE